jgi:carboxyl-terminal processing protease
MNTSSPAPSGIKNFALGLLGMFVGTLIFVLGVAVGGTLSRPGGLLSDGLPFPTTRTSAVDPVAGIGSDTNAAATGRLNQTLVNDVLRRLRTDWYGELPSNDKLTDGAIRGMVNSLGDPFTQYVEPSLARIIQQDISGKFEGIGATLRSVQSAVQIVRVFPSSPAEKAGVQSGDFIESVDGRNVNGLGTNEVAALVRGTKGTVVTLMLRREGRDKAFEIKITRDEINIPLVTSRMIGPKNDIAYVSLFDFSAQANKQLSEDLKALLDKKPRALVFDLRDNPGGLLSQSVEVGDIFLKRGAFVIERDFKGNRKQTDTTDTGIAQDIPMVVLVNGGSASAAEIVAGALQDYGRARVIGETTFGKGSVQSPQQLPNGGQLRVTIERWYTPKDRAINGVGVKPDIVVGRTADDQKANKDPQLDAAIEFLETGEAP